MKPHWNTAPLAKALHEALKQQGIERQILEQEIVIRWEEIVGIAIARQARPGRIRNGVLWIEVEDAAWRQELSLMRLELVETINKAVGERIVEEIHLR
jgi:predicted nucleic acid-binding Zn ribbon protein